MPLPTKFGIMAKNIFIIGISGATNSGKTSTVEQLCKHFPNAVSICQDCYFLEPGDDRLELLPELNHANWEKLSAMDMDQMLTDIHSVIDRHQAECSNKTKLLIIEGILIFNHRALSRLFDKKYFLTLDRHTCKQRRDGRVYTPADPPHYFEKVVWPMYLQNMQEVKEQPDICYMHGTGDRKIVFEKIKNDILAICSRCNPK